MSSHTDHGFVDLDPSTAAPAARAILEATRAELGFLPSVVAKMAVSPALYSAFRSAAAAFDATSLGLAERETVVLVAAREIGCDVCVTMHRGILARAGHEAVAKAIVAREPLPDARLAVLADFTVELLRARGDVAEGPWSAFLAAGFTREQALEIVLGLGAYTMSTYANRLTGGTLRASSSTRAEQIPSRS